MSSLIMSAVNAYIAYNLFQMPQRWAQIVGWANVAASALCFTLFLMEI